MEQNSYTFFDFCPFMSKIKPTSIKDGKGKKVSCRETVNQLFLHVNIVSIFFICHVKHHQFLSGALGFQQPVPCDFTLPCQLSGRPLPNSAGSD